jgi:UrcA family protein
MTLQIQSRHRLLITLAFFPFAAACLPASAGERPTNEEASITVKFRDLDLNTDAGRHELLNRLSKAAARVCFENVKSLDVFGMPQIHLSCYRHTLAAAVDKVHHAQLSALFAALSRGAR